MFHPFHRRNTGTLSGRSSKNGGKAGAPDWIRTSDLCLRRAALYPAELRVPVYYLMPRQNPQAVEWTGARLAKRPAAWKRNVWAVYKSGPAAITVARQITLGPLAIWQAMPGNNRRAMNAYSSDFHQLGNESTTLPIADRGQVLGAVLDESISLQWAALHDAAAAVSALGNLQSDMAESRLPDVAALVAGAPEWKSTLLRNALEDISAIMQSGLAALLAVTATGRDPAAAAHALLVEFEFSRGAFLALVQDQGA